MVAPHCIRDQLRGILLASAWLRFLLSPLLSSHRGTTLGNEPHLVRSLQAEIARALLVRLFLHGVVRDLCLGVFLELELDNLKDSLEVIVEEHLMPKLLD